MRSYENDNAKAVARIISMALLADGVPDRSELQHLSRRRALSRFGIDQQVFDEVLQAFCEDLQQSVAWFDGLRGEFAPELIDALLEEVDDIEQQQELFALLLQLATVDGEVSEGESRLISRARQKWGRGGRWPIRLRPRFDAQPRLPV
jgi:uncharacterized tellurite resistance protein B-like protein